MPLRCNYDMLQYVCNQLVQYRMDINEFASYIVKTVYPVLPLSFNLSYRACVLFYRISFKGL